MEINDKDIEKLDFILNRLVSRDVNVIANDLHKEGYYDEYNNATELIEKDFKFLQSVYQNIGIGRIVDTKDAECIFPDSRAILLHKNGGFKRYFENLKTNESKDNERQLLKDKIDKLNYESLKHKETIREQEDRIRGLSEQLTRINLLKAYWWVIGIGFGLGLLIAKLF